MKNLPEQKPPASAKKSFWFWLPGSVIALLFLLLTALLLATHIISSAAVRQKIQQTVVEKSGVRIDWEAIRLSYFPSPVITIRQATLTVPDRVQGRIDELHIFPEILPLLTGDLRLSRLRLERPAISLALPTPKPDEPPAQSSSLVELEKNLLRVLAPLAQVVPDFDLVIRDGRLSVAGGRQMLIEAENLDLQLTLSMDGPNSGRATLRGEAAALNLRRNDQLKTIKGVDLNASVEMTGGTLSVVLARLALAEPGLELSGSLALAPRVPGITLSLSGKNIDVDATREVALALAGDVPPVRDIFAYLLGGKVSQFTFQSQGETASELGAWKNLRIAGKLQQGAVSIPPVKLDLTEVVADVLVAEGVLEGREMSARLEGSSGHDGTLKIGLAKGNDLFQLELMLAADLAQTKRILERIVKNPDFNEEMGRISHLQGAGVGKLRLGDSLDRLSARLDLTELNFTADYQRVPFPIQITRGQVTFSEKQINLNGWDGSIGLSNFTDLACQVNLADVLKLDFSSGPSALSLDELYPWLASFDDAPRQLKDFTQVSGRLDLDTLRFRGSVDQPQQWQFAARGTVQNLHLTHSHFPAEIRLVKGGFTLDTEQLTFEKLEARSLDADLTLTGTVQGLPQGLDRLDVALNGKLGQAAVAWLRDTFEVPAAYTIRAPLSLSEFKVTWQPDAATATNGGISIEKGPDLTLDVGYQPNQLKVNKLTVKDQHSDAVMALASGPEGFSLDFAGALQDETLDALFVDQRFGKGRLEGDFSVKAPGTTMAGALAKGQLKGSNLLLPLPSGDKLEIEQIMLAADGAAIRAELTTLAWRDYTWAPVKATIDFSQDKTYVRVAEAKLCGINSPGVLTIASKDLTLDFTLGGKGLDLASSYSCLTQGEVRMTGVLDFSSHIRAQGLADELMRKMHGPLEMTFSNGVIKQQKLLARILEVLNVTEVVKGRLPDLGSTGFAYTTITLQGEFRSGKLLIEKLYMDGETLDILGHGEVDMGQETLNLELLAAPFKTADTVVKNIPGLNYLLAGSLVAIPVSIKGKWDDPGVRVMSASSVGSSLLNLGKRTIKSTFKLIDTLVPGGKSQDR